MDSLMAKQSGNRGRDDDASDFYRYEIRASGTNSKKGKTRSNWRVGVFRVLAWRKTIAVNIDCLDHAVMLPGGSFVRLHPVAVASSLRRFLPGCRAAAQTGRYQSNAVLLAFDGNGEVIGGECATLAGNAAGQRPAT